MAAGLPSKSSLNDRIEAITPETQGAAYEVPVFKAASLPSGCVVRISTPLKTHDI